MGIRMGAGLAMERPTRYTMVKCNGQGFWKLPYPYEVLPSSGRIVAIDPKGVTRLVNRKSITKY